MEKVFIHGTMERYMMDNGAMVLSMDLVSGEVFFLLSLKCVWQVFTEIRILVNGRNLKRKAMVFIRGRMVI